MSTFEFKIRVDQQVVTGEYGPRGSQLQPAGSAPLAPDPLILDTVVLMNRWLSFWDLIEMSEIRLKETLLDSGTLDVLGTHLWRLLLNNAVGDELRLHIPAEGDSPLRLSIEFAEKAHPTLKGLPWEFLYEPENKWYLATRTELLLTRYVTTSTRPAAVPMAGRQDTLHALLIAALPRKPDFAMYREALWQLRNELRNVPSLEVPAPIEEWDPGVVRAKLTARPYHIVHVVGICRGTPGNPKIFLGPGGVDGFHDPATFVDALTVNKERPRLVILQLCDYVDGDATENFERMAPALIQKGIPAVLALQYAARPQADTVGLGVRFYRSLVGGEQVGVAVQDSRRELMGIRLDRLFGTPVLYLQDDVVLRRPQSRAVQPAPTAQAVRTRSKPVRTVLMLEMRKARGLDDQAEADLLDWVSELGRDDGPEKVAKAIKEKLLGPVDPMSAVVYASMIRALGSES